jgi:hypothetical protein
VSFRFLMVFGLSFRMHMRGSLKSTGRFGAVLLENLVGFCIFNCSLSLFVILGGGYWVIFGWNWLVLLCGLVLVLHSK